MVLIRTEYIAKFSYGIWAALRLTILCLFGDNGQHNRMTAITITGLYFKNLVLEEN